MSSSSALEKAKQFGLPREQVIILYHITAWFNQRVFEIRGRKVSIATAHEPPLRQLCGDDWDPSFDEHHEALIDRGLLKADTGGASIYVAGRRCRWLPTRDGMQVIEHLFSHRDDIYPNWVHDNHTRPPTFRDGEELMEHRKGTMAARFTFKQLEEYVTGASVYPQFSNSNRPDLRLFNGGDLIAYTETQTDHNNSQSRVEKFAHWRKHSSAPPVIWVFANREVMVNFWNDLVTNGHVTLDGGRFTEPANNWSARRVNDRVRRSGLRQFSWTIAGVLNADAVDAFEFLKRNNIILDS
jgi:hypothetical protein